MYYVCYGAGLLAEEAIYSEPVKFVVHGEIFQLYSYHEGGSSTDMTVLVQAYLS